MSADTKAALEAAIEAHIANECEGDMAGAWIVLTETTSLADIDDENSAFYLEGRVNQSRFVTDGLLYNALHRE